MLEIARTIRFCINLSGDAESDTAQPRVNTYANWPSPRGLCAYYELIVRCIGDPDPLTGYLINIRVIDDAVRTNALPIIAKAVRDTPDVTPEMLLGPICDTLANRLGTTARLAAVRWMLTPFHGVEMDTADMNLVEITQQFDFAAAHRLNVPAISDDENRAIFGKCNNPNGHGHNYRIEVAVAAKLDGGRASIGLDAIESIVHDVVITRFDHKHLNLDTIDFDELNPSVEHIAQICHGLLAAPIAAAGGTLSRVTVWETEKTACTYPGRLPAS